MSASIRDIDYVFYDVLRCGCIDHTEHRRVLIIVVQRQSKDHNVVSLPPKIFFLFTENKLYCFREKWN